MQSILGQKIDQTEKFLENGTRIPVTAVKTVGNVVVHVGNTTIQLGFGLKKKGNKGEVGHVKGANLKEAPKFLREIKVEPADLENIKAGDQIKGSDVLRIGDFVDVIGVSKGKGFAGGVKRHHFKGGPRTHGQSDRERAPGSIGQTTTPGRVYKGKRMAGRMGVERVTVKNLTVAHVSADEVLIKGLVPGPKNSYLIIQKVGENKKFVPLYKDDEATKNTEVQNEVANESEAPITENTEKIKDTQEQNKTSEDSLNSVIAREEVKEEEDVS